MADIQESMCLKMEAELDKSISKLRMLTDIIEDQVDALRNELLAIASKPVSLLDDLLAGLDAISDDAAASLPPDNVDTSQLDDMIANCPYVKDLYGAYTDAEKAAKDKEDALTASTEKKFNDFSESIGGGSGGWASTVSTFGEKLVDAYKESGDYATSAFDDVTNSITAKIDSLKALLPELGIDDFRQSIEDKLSDLSIGKIKDAIDVLINCLSAICGKNMTSTIDEVNTILEDSGLDLDGNLDMSTLMDDAGLTDDHKTNINESTIKMLDVRDSAKDSVSNSGENYLNTLKNKFF